MHGRLPSPVSLWAVEPEGARPLPVRAGARDAHEALDGLPTGVYEGMRTFGGERFLGLEEHFDRLDRSMALLGWPERLERERVRRSLQHAVSRLDGEAFVRLDVLREPPRELDAEARTLLALSPLAAPPQRYLREGVGVSIARGLQRPDPRIKAADFVLVRRPFPLGRQDAYEHLLVDEEGRLLEGTSSNVHAVLDGVVRSAAAGALPGITRAFVLRLCAELGLAVSEEAVHLDDLPRLEEAFLTSSTRGVVPVVAIAGHSVARGAVGERTRRLISAYAELCEREARPAWPASAPA